MEENINMSAQLSYDDAKKQVIDDLKKIKIDDPSLTLFVGPKPYSPDELLVEVENETEFGKNYVESYIEGLKLLNKK